MATAFSIYNPAREYLADGTILWETDTLKLALVSSGYTFSNSHSQWASASGSEVATGSGYTTGGAALASAAISRSSAIVKYDAADVTFTALTKTFRAGVLYANVTRNGVTNPLIGYLLFDDTPADTVSSGTDYVVQWNASGIIQIT
jgi:voltage-gated potassium channel Kch